MSAAPPQLDEAIYQRNVSALRDIDSELAARLESHRSGLVIETAWTRDGWISFRVTDGSGPESWFGRTSIPAVRAGALVERFEAGNANVLLPGFGEGTEAKLLFEQFGPHRAVFVFEPDLETIRLSLRLHDFAEAIESGRLVFMAAELESLEDHFLAWLDAHPGHYPPNRIMLWPWLTERDLVPLQSVLERVYQQCEQRRQRQLRKLREQLAGADASMASHESSGRIAVLSLLAAEETWTLGDALSAAATEMGMKSVLVDVRRPGDMHPLARLRHLTDQLQGPAGKAVLINLTRRELPDVLSETTSAVSWLDPNHAHATDLATRIGPHDHVAVTCELDATSVRNAGLDKSRVHIVPLPCLAGDVDAPPWSDRSIDIACFVEAYSLDPALYGFTLQTHINIWHAAVKRLGENILTFAPNQIDQIVTRAESQVGARLPDDGTRCRFASALIRHAVPTLISQRLVAQLRDSGLTVRIAGRRQLAKEDLAVDCCAETTSHRKKILRNSRIFLGSSDGSSSQLEMLLAAGCGALVVTRPQPGDREPGGIAQLLDPDSEMRILRFDKDLIAVLKSLLADPEIGRRVSRAGRERCMRDHTPAARLSALTTLAGPSPTATDL